MVSYYRERRPTAQKKRPGPSRLNPVPAGLNLSPGLPQSVMPSNTSVPLQIGPMMDLGKQRASKPGLQGVSIPGIKDVNTEGALEPAVPSTAAAVPQIGPMLDLTEELNLPPKFGNNFAGISIEDAVPTGETLAGLQGGSYQPQAAAPQPQAAAPQPQAGLGIMPSPGQEAPVHRGLPNSQDVTGMNPVEKLNAMRAAQNHIPSSAGDYVGRDGVSSSEVLEEGRKLDKKLNQRTSRGGHTRFTGPGGNVTDRVNPVGLMGGGVRDSDLALTRWSAPQGRWTEELLNPTQADMDRALDGVEARGGTRRADGGWTGTNSTGLTPSERREAIYALQAGEEVPDELLRGTSPNEMARLERAAGRADRAAQARADRMNSPAGMAAIMKGTARRNRMGLGPAPTLGNAMAMAGDPRARAGAVLGGQGLAGVEAAQARGAAEVGAAQARAAGGVEAQRIDSAAQVAIAELQKQNPGITRDQILALVAQSDDPAMVEAVMRAYDLQHGGLASGPTGVRRSAQAPYNPRRQKTPEEAVEAATASGKYRRVIQGGPPEGESAFLSSGPASFKSDADRRAWMQQNNYNARNARQRSFLDMFPNLYGYGL